MQDRQERRVYPDLLVLKGILVIMDLLAHPVNPDHPAHKANLDQKV
jgi:hypothetical protein